MQLAGLICWKKVKTTHWREWQKTHTQNKSCNTKAALKAVCRAGENMWVHTVVLLHRTREGAVHSITWPPRIQFQDSQCPLPSGLWGLIYTASSRRPAWLQENLLSGKEHPVWRYVPLIPGITEAEDC